MSGGKAIGYVKRGPSRRLRPRIRCQFPVLCQIGEQAEIEAQVLDLGPEGMRLALPIVVEKLQLIQVAALPGEFERLLCVVVWSRLEGSLCLAGLRYADAPPKPAQESSNLPVEIQDHAGRLLARGTVRELTVGGALVVVNSRLPEGQLLRVGMGGTEPSSALHLLASATRNVAVGGHAYNLRFNPAQRGQLQRLSHLLLTLVHGLGEGTPPALDWQEEPEPLALPPGLIFGMLNLRGSLAAVLASPAVPPPGRPYGREVDGQRGWLAQCPASATRLPSSSNRSELLRLLTPTAPVPPQSLLHRLLALLALGGSRALSHSLTSARVSVSLYRRLAPDDGLTPRLIHWAALLKDIGELDWLLSHQSQPYRWQLTAFVRRLEAPASPEDLRGLRVRGSLFLTRPSLERHEREELGMHPVRSQSLLDALPGLGRLAPLVRGHHERWDGMGYPDGLRGEAIPFAARCLAVADAYATLLGEGHAPREAARQVASASGSWFDPTIVDLLSRSEPTS